MKKRDISPVGIIALIIAILVISCNHFKAQTVTHKRDKSGDIRWNNYLVFKNQEKEKFLNWQSFPDSWDGKQFAIWSIFGLAGTMDGMIQAFHRNPLCFEKNWRGVKKISFFGSRQDLLNYNNNDPAQGHKTEILGNFGRDFWHTWNFGFQMSFGGGSAAQSARHQPWKYKIANYAIAMVIHSAFAKFAYHSLQ